jgi:RND family efflux transporter MFP subunit
MITRAIRYLPPVLVIGLLGGAVNFFNSPSREGSVGSSADTEIPVRVAQVRKLSVPAKMSFMGDLQAITQAEVVSRLAGEVAEVRFKVGDFVAAGAVVATIRTHDVDQRIAGLVTNVAAAKQELRLREDQLAQAEKTLAQDREYFRRDLIARRDVEQAETEVETARAQAELARAHLAQQEAMLAQVRALQGLSRLSAPISGAVSRRMIEPGAAVAEGAAIMAVASLDSLKLNANVSVGDGAGSNLRPGRNVQITTAALPGVISEGKVIRFEPHKDEGGIAEIEIQISNPQKKLRPGMAVEASIDSKIDEEVLVVPRSSVASEKDLSYVYKISGDRALRQPVVVGRERGDEMTIVSGLKDGESVVIDPAKVRSGIRVRAEIPTAKRRK